jgi:signal transduction histidine kinase/AmiR/NasT family two-component response regulator
LLIWSFLSVLALPLVHASTAALDVSLPRTGPVLLAEYLHTLEDADHSMTLAQVQQADQDGLFNQHEAGGALNLGYTRSAYWLRLDLRNNSDTAVERILEIAYSGLSDVQVFQPHLAGAAGHITTGSLQPFASRPYANRFFVFPLTIAAQSQMQVYIRLQSIGPLSVPATLWEPKAYSEYELSDYAAQSWYFGMAMSIIIFNLLLFLALRDVSYLQYVLFSTSLALTMAVQNGLAKQLLWLEWPALAAIAANTGFSLSLATLLIFMRKMINTAVLLPRFDRILRVLIGLFFASPIAFAWNLKLLLQPMAVVYAATALIVLGAGIVCAFKRERSAYFFVAAFVLLALAAVSTVLRFMGILTTNVLTVNALQMASALEMLLLALALADRFNAQKKWHSVAQDHLLQSQNRVMGMLQASELLQKRAVEALQASEQVLEARVIERTVDLDQKNTALKAAIATLEDVERIARHDLKTPLASLVAAPSLLRVGRTPNAKEEVVLRSMENAAKRALSMVDLSLDLYRIHNGSYQLNAVAVDLVALVHNVVQDLREHAQSKCVLVEVDVEVNALQAQQAEKSVYAQADDALCYSIIANITKNAVEAAPENSTVRLRLQSGTMARLSVHNMGAVPMALRPIFFEKYTTSGKVGGTGLGTYSAYILAQAQGGSLCMDTSDTLGTTLTLELKGAIAPTQTSATPNGAVRQQLDPTIDHVLLVDDDEFSSMVLASLLPASVGQTDMAINGRMAVQAVMRQRPSIIIMDIEMPIMNGTDAMLQIRAYQLEKGQIPSFIVAATGNDDPQNLNHYQAAGFDLCLGKPIQKESVETLLRLYCAAQNWPAAAALTRA